MIGKILSWLLSSTGYLLYTIIVMVCLLWFLFPADAARGWLEQQLNRQYSQFNWKIGSLELAPTDGVVLTNVKVAPAGGEVSLLTFDRFAISPDLSHLFGEDRVMNYSLRMLKGTVRGQLILSQESAQFECRGNLEGLQLQQLDILGQHLERTFTGSVNGDFSGQGTWKAVRQLQLGGNLSVIDGTFEFREPVLGLEQLPYSKMESGFSYTNGQWTFEKGNLVSTRMNGTFSGEIKAGDTLADSQLQFKGSVSPRSEMFAELKNKEMVKVVRAHLKEEGLPFTINGTAAEPGILFAGSLSQALKTMQGSTR